MRPNIFSILAGKHGVGMSPERETEWAWAFLLLGWMVGAVCGCLLTSWLCVAK